MEKILIFVVFLGGMLFRSCSPAAIIDGIRGSGNLGHETRSVQDFHGVELDTLGELTITLGSEESLDIEAESNLLPYFVTAVKNGILVIRQDANTNLQPTLPVRYELIVKDLDNLSVRSSGNIHAPVLTGEQIQLDVRSSGNIYLDGLDSDQLEINISSSGNIEIQEGQVKEQDVTLSSSGDYEAGDVRSESATARISSSGNATLWVTEQLNVTLSSSGNVNYYGRPDVSERTTSSGRTKSMGDK